jgi:TonB family protein
MIRDTLEAMKRTLTFGFVLAGLLAGALAASAQKVPEVGPDARAQGAPARIAEEKSGTLSPAVGRLKLSTDLGNVRILTQAPAQPVQVQYRVRVEADPSQPDAEKLLKQFQVAARSTAEGAILTGQVPWKNFRGRLWVHFEATVPRNFQLDVTTHAGSIEAQDMDGRVSFFTAGGNITAGMLGSGARLESLGGHITTGDVGGTLTALTAGGHVNVGNVRGDAILRTAGGHIRAVNIRGSTQLETGGGNISVQRAGAGATASSGGGRIEFGEASGSIRARTSGGGIRVARLVGPTELETAGGSIYLTRVLGAVRAQTASGSITAWFTPEGKLRGASALESGQGDIVVYVPRNLPLTIDARIELAAEHGIDADPAFPLKFVTVPAGPGSDAVRAECALNGGGERLELRTTAGNIKLRFLDQALRQNELLFQMQMEQLQKRMEEQQRALELQLERQMRLLEEGKKVVAGATRSPKAGTLRPAPAPEPAPDFSWRFWERFSGRYRVSPEKQKERLVHGPKPAYPEIARRAGIEGVVRLEVVVGRDGSVQDVRALSGHPLLVEAALAAVRQWRYRALEVEGKPAIVITTVDVSFRLN